MVLLKKVLCILILLFNISFINTLLNGKVEYSMSDIDSKVKEIVWCGNSNEVLLALTEMDSLYISDNKGFMWKKLNDLITHTAKTELEDQENEIGKVSKILLSPVDKNLVIFLGTHGINWISHDCVRKNDKALNHGRKITQFNSCSILHKESGA